MILPDSSLAERLELLLGSVSGQIVVVTEEGAAARLALEELAPEVALCHVDMVGSGAGSLMAAQRQFDSVTPIIVLAPARSERQAIQAVNDGAVTCLSLTPTAEQLQAALIRAHELRDIIISARRYDVAEKRRSASRGAAGAAFATALEQLYMAWQPIVDTRSGEVFGYEALVRSDAPGFPSAWHVLDHAARLDREEELHQTVLEHVAEDIESGELQGVLTVNLSLDQLLRGTHGTPSDPLLPHASRVVLEVNENGRIHSIDEVARAVRELRDCGYRIAVDDLGAGHDYLARLLALEPDLYKLDRLALADCDRDPRKRRYVQAVVSMARREGAQVVAEGIERGEEASLAAALGCQLLQGYLLGRPQRRSFWTRSPVAAYRLAREASDSGSGSAQAGAG